jgi:DNA-binding beta-propeller fold protein YncE
MIPVLTKISRLTMIPYLSLMCCGLLLAHEDCEAACWRELPLQNPRAIAIGETVYLPQQDPTKSGKCPKIPQWTVASKPPESLQVLFGDGTTDNQRFSPDQPGSYIFEENQTGFRWSITVLRKSAQERFRNHYLTPLYGASRVKDEIWVANGAASSVSKIQKQPDGTYGKQGEFPTGSWPAAVVGDEKLPYVLVAQRGADSVAYIDRSSGRLIDALWVGDEPTGLALSADGQTLYVSLATERKIAVVDVKRHETKKWIPVGFDPRSLALSNDGKTLYAASYRSANLSYGPGGSRPPETDLDVFIVDTLKGTWVKSIPTLAADLRALAWSDEDRSLYIAATDGDTLVAQNDPLAKPFVHQVIEVKFDGNGENHSWNSVRTKDLYRQPSSQGPFVNPSGVLVHENELWLTAESSHQVMILDRNTLEEKKRISVGRGPRQMVLLEDGVAVHCFQSFELYILGFDGSIKQQISVAQDPRPTDVALGEEVFTRPGIGFGANHSCSSCHIEMQNDGMIWSFGPNVWHNVRPIQLAAATTPLSWSSYAANAKSFGYMGPFSIMNRPPTNQEALGLGAFMDSLLGAPRATHWTGKDGSYSQEALVGKALFEGKARCSSCHEPPLYTNRSLIPRGKSGKEADVPTLLGVYRHGVYMIKGQARDLETAVDVALNYVKVRLEPQEKLSLVRFLKELTPKGAYPLGIWPDRDSNTLVPRDAQPWVAFSEPVDDTQRERSQESLLREFIHLETGNADTVAVTYEVEAGKVRLIPKELLRPGETYRLRVRAGLPFRDGSIQEGERLSSFVTVQNQPQTLPKSMTLVVDVPSTESQTGLPKTRETRLDMALKELTPEGQEVELDLGGGLRQKLLLWQDGVSFKLQSFALPVFFGSDGEALADGSHVEGSFVQEDPIMVRGTLTVGAPGLRFSGVSWRLEKSIDQEKSPSFN